MALTKIRQEQGVVINEGSTDVDFRVESDTGTHALFVQGSDGNVGIGTGSPDCRLHSVEATNNSSSTGLANGGLQIENTNTTTGSWSQLHLRSVAYDAHLRLLNDGTLRIMTDGNTSAMTITDAGNVGIGASPVNSRLYVSGSGFAGQLLIAPTTSTYVGIGHGEDDPAIHWRTGDFRFATSTARDLTGFSEKMRITNAGNVGIGTSSPSSPLHVATDEADFVARFNNDGNNANRLGIFVQTGTDDGSGTNVFFAAYDGDGTETGQLRSVSGTFQLTDTSDERLKQDIVDTTVSGLTSVNSIKVRDFSYKRNPTETIKAGFIAQELQTVFSSAVSYSESDSDKILSVSRERLVPVLVKAIQELSAKNDALEARITTLEG